MRAISHRVKSQVNTRYSFDFLGMFNAYTEQVCDICESFRHMYVEDCLHPRLMV
jgi:hypothetical protein